MSDPYCLGLKPAGIMADGEDALSREDMLQRLENKDTHTLNKLLDEQEHGAEIIKKEAEIVAINEELVRARNKIEELQLKKRTLVREKRLLEEKLYGPGRFPNRGRGRGRYKPYHGRGW